MSIPRVVITEFMDEAAVRWLGERFAVLYDPTLGESSERFRAAMADTEAVIVRNRTRIDRSILASAPRLRVIGRLGVGLEMIDTEACRERGIAVIVAAGANADSVAEYVLAAAMLLLRRLGETTARILAGEWPRSELIGHELGGRVLGLVGFGTIARRIVPRAHALSLSVLAYDPLVSEAEISRAGAKPQELNTLLAEADIVSLHVPLTQATHGLLDRRRLALLRHNAIVINTARGGIVDEDALLEALREGRLAGAALDVFSEEPPDEPARFRDVPNLLLTPHIAGVTVESNQRVSRVIAERVADVLGGER